MKKENFDDWKRKTLGRIEEGTENIQSRKMCCVWWNEDPSETPYRPQSDEQFAKEYQNTLSDVPCKKSFENSPSELPNMWDGISTKTTKKSNSLRKDGMFEGEGEIISRIVVGVKHRVDRLKALGEGQVPEVVRVVWELLNNGRT